MKTPGINIPFVSQGSREACLTSDVVGIPITISETRVTGTVKGPSLFARRTASPYKARPFRQVANITSYVASTATLDIPDVDAVKFAVGDSVGYWDVTAAFEKPSGEPESLSAYQVIDTIGAAGSGAGGAGFTLITLVGAFATAPATGDKLYVTDGSHLSENVVVVLNDVTIDGTNDVIETGFIEGVFNKALVGNATYFEQSKNQKIQLVDIV